MLIRLEARPRVYPLGWPHRMNVSSGEIQYEWASIHPDGTGWSTLPSPSDAFPEKDLKEVLELFYDNHAGSWPFDFQVYVVGPEPGPKKLHKKPGTFLRKWRKAKAKKKPAPEKKRRST